MKKLLDENEKLNEMILFFLMIIMVLKIELFLANVATCGGFYFNLRNPKFIFYPIVSFRQNYILT